MPVKQYILGMSGGRDAHWRRWSDEYTDTEEEFTVGVQSTQPWVPQRIVVPRASHFEYEVVSCSFGELSAPYEEGGCFNYRVIEPRRQQWSERTTMLVRRRPGSTATKFVSALVGDACT